MPVIIYLHEKHTGMPTYLKANINLTRQAGDIADIVIIVPEALNMTGRTVNFRVTDKAGRILIKNPAGLTIEAQTITIPLLPVDTKGKAGSHNYEVEVVNQQGPITILAGTFTITKELIK
jgi:hypothetical protein